MLEILAEAIVAAGFRRPVANPSPKGNPTMNTGRVSRTLRFTLTSSGSGNFPAGTARTARSRSESAATILAATRNSCFVPLWNTHSTWRAARPDESWTTWALVATKPPAADFSIRNPEPMAKFGPRGTRM